MSVNVDLVIRFLREFTKRFETKHNQETELVAYTFDEVFVMANFARIIWHLCKLVLRTN